MIILVAEDEAIIALALKLDLDLAGHQVLGPAADVDEALQLATERRPDLGLIDLHLRSGGDGLRLARALKEQWSVPCLLLSAYTVEARTASDVAVGLIGKPYELDEVVEAVAAIGELLAGRRPARMPRRLELFGAWAGPA